MEKCQSSSSHVYMLTARCCWHHPNGQTDTKPPYIYIYIHTCNNSSSPANIMDTDRYETAIYTHTHVLLITNRILVYPTCNNSSPPLVYIQCVLIKRACCVRACTTRVFLGVSKGLCEKNIKNGIFAKSTSLHDFPYMLSLTCIYYLKS